MQSVDAIGNHGEKQSVALSRVLRNTLLLLQHIMLHGEMQGRVSAGVAASEPAKAMWAAYIQIRFTVICVRLRAGKG
jgi:hypothetical protein